MNCKNQYLKIVLSIAGLSAVPIAIFTLTSCDGSNVKSLVEAQPTPAGLYHRQVLDHLLCKPESGQCRIGQFN